MGDVALVPSPGGPWPGSWQCLERLLDAGNGGAADGNTAAEGWRTGGVVRKVRGIWAGPGHPHGPDPAVGHSGEKLAREEESVPPGLHAAPMGVSPALHQALDARFLQYQGRQSQGLALFALTGSRSLQPRDLLATGDGPSYGSGKVSSPIWVLPKIALTWSHVTGW